MPKSTRPVAHMVMLMDYVDELVAFGKDEAQARTLLFEAFKRQRRRRGPSHPLVEAIGTVEEMEEYFGTRSAPVTVGEARDMGMDLPA